MKRKWANIGRKMIVKRRFVRGCYQSSGNKGWPALNRLAEETVSSLNTLPIPTVTEISSLGRLLFINIFLTNAFYLTEINYIVIYQPQFRHYS